MKKTSMLLLAGLFAATASIAQTNIARSQPGVTYGKAINAEQAIQMTDLDQKLQSDTIYIGKVEGKVVEVCKKKGCFMKLERASGEAVMVKFTDYAFFMPQDIVGKTVVIEGTAKVNETSVERLKHFAEDAGKSKKEIAKITAPKKDIVFVADGVVVVK
ncbi:DUF4920 domain-containing protein [Chitinophaga sp. SYP-B3965]|uniref:DUF4920 domain-containing protein n=1 Tax=Chitinophaga sp. SYP-B3965 TaxID=2663120 RepID=UPI001299EE08|nr:DUF4920 domain-containing protein [Chitinophaga sp. SYP-B3965]MRG48555.1 DUF4920 domain-containing protein [Chitinophaga sp. SYP-B3965]